MNWRRGLFRLWIVGTVLFVIAVAFVSYSEIKQQFEPEIWVDDTTGDLQVPQLCGDARGVAGVDYGTERRQRVTLCWYAMPKFRSLYPEYNNLSDKELSRKLYADNDPGVPIRDLLWATFRTWASIAFGIPLAVLVLGASLVWAFSGFAAKRP
jgi:hypothetical protein